VNGNKIKTIREKFGLSTPEFAELIGVRGSSVYRWEAAGKVTPKVEGRPLKLLELSSKLLAPQAAAVAEIFRAEGWIGGLYKLLRFAYKK
jgi:DNA-binding XRE family transcriptional regulator